MSTFKTRKPEYSSAPKPMPPTPLYYLVDRGTHRQLDGPFDSSGEAREAISWLAPNEQTRAQVERRVREEEG